MNTTTNRRFAFRRLLPCLALLVPSVSGTQPPASGFDCSSSADMATYKSLDIDSDELGKMYFFAQSDAMTMAAKAEGLDKAGSPHTGEAYLVAAQALAKCIGYGVELLSSSENYDEDGLELDKVIDLLCTCAYKADEYGADTTALVKIYRDMGRYMDKYGDYFRAQGDEVVAVSTYAFGTFWMKVARLREIGVPLDEIED